MFKDAILSLPYLQLKNVNGDGDSSSKFTKEKGPKTSMSILLLETNCFQQTGHS